MKHAKEGRVKMDSVKDAQEHFGYDNSEWNELRKSKQKELREVSYKRHQRGSTYAEGGEINDVDFQEWKKATISNRAKILGRVSEMRQAEGGVKYYKSIGYDVSEIEEALNPFSTINENNTYAEGGEIDNIDNRIYEHEKIIEALERRKKLSLRTTEEVKSDLEGKYGKYATRSHNFAKGGLTKGYHKMPDGEIMKNSEHLPLIGGIVGVLLGIFLNR